MVAAVDPSGWFPFSVIKWWGLVALTSLAAAAAVWSSASRAKRREHTDAWDRALVWAWVSMLAVVAASAIGTAGWRPWLGTAERHLGVLTWIVFAVLFWLGRAIGRDHRGRLVLDRFWFASAVALSLWTVAELAGVPPVETGGADRLTGALGNPAYSSAAALLLIGAVLSSARRGAIRPGLARLVVFGCFVTIVAAQSRATLIGGVTMALVWRFSERRTPAAGETPPDPRRRIILATALAGAIVVVLLSPFGARLTSSLGDGVDSRLAEWRVGWSAFVDSPILGHGPEGYVLVAHRHLDEQYVQDYGRDVAIDRAHQGLLDIGLAHGAIGIVAYLVLLCLMVRALWQHADHVDTPLVAAVVGYLVLQQGLFVVAEIDALWWLLAGSLVASSRTGGAAPDGVAQVQEAHQPTAAARRVGARAIAVVMAAAFVAAAAVGAQSLSADRLARQARDDAEAADRVGGSSSALAVAERAVQRRPDVLRYRLLAADLATRSGRFVDANGHLDRADDIAPGHPSVRLLDGVLAVATATVSPGQGVRDLAVAVGEAAVRQDPFHPALWLLLGEGHRLAGDGGQAEQAYRRAAELAPDDVAPWVALGHLALERGRLGTAVEAVGAARRIQPDSLEVAQLQAAVNRAVALDDAS